MGYVLVTGCNGFVGNKLVKNLLGEGYQVLGVSTGENRIGYHENFKYIKVDITNRIIVEQIFRNFEISSVIHLAAIAHLKNRKNLNWNTYYRVNALASKAIFKCAIASKAKVFYASSVDVYGNMPASELSENLIPSPVSDYAKSKLIAENILIKSAKEHSHEYVIARFAPVYAKGYMKDANKRIYLKYPNLAFRIAGGDDYHFVSINNVIDFIKEWLADGQGRIQGTYNICDRKLINSKEFIALEKQVNRSNYVMVFPKFIFNLPVKILSLFYKLWRNNKIRKQYININKLINPSKYSIEKMEKVFQPFWDLENSVYKEKD